MEKSLDPGKIGRKITTKDMIMCALFTALIAVGAFIKVPVPVVPFTLQFLFTMLAGLIMGGRLGAISVGLYAVLGLEMCIRDRINTVLDADQIVVMDEGHMAGIGTHEELMQSCEVYKEIALSQLSEEELERGRK